MLMLWSVPRSRSTAFYRTMIERGDTRTVRRLTGRDPLVVDAGDLMKRPADIIEAYCARVGIDFRPDALTWQPSDRPEWGGGFKHWFADVAASSGLAEVPGRRRPDLGQHPMLGTYLAYHLPFYQKLYQRRLVVLGHSARPTGRGPSPHRIAHSPALSSSPGC